MQTAHIRNKSSSKSFVTLDLVFSKKQKAMIAWIGGPRDESLDLDLALDLVFSKKQKAMIPWIGGAAR